MLLIKAKGGFKMFNMLFGKKKSESKEKFEISASMKEDLKLLASEDKLKAIKIYREMTSCGLKEAKDFVDSLSRVDIEISESVKEDLKLIATRNKIEAVKMYREMTNCGLKEANDFINSL